MFEASISNIIKHCLPEIVIPQNWFKLVPNCFVLPRHRLQAMQQLRRPGSQEQWWEADNPSRCHVRSTQSDVQVKHQGRLFHASSKIGLMCFNLTGVNMIQDVYRMCIHLSYEVKVWRPCKKRTKFRSTVVCWSSHTHMPCHVPGYILEAEPSQRYLIPVSPPESSLDTSKRHVTPEVPGPGPPVTVVTAPEVRQGPAPKQGSGPSPPREGRTSWLGGTGLQRNAFSLQKLCVAIVAVCYTVGSWSHSSDDSCIFLLFFCFDLLFN